MANKVGANIRIILAMLEKHGPLTGAQLCGLDATMDREQVGKYCSRAVGLGLATVKRGEGSRSNPSTFTAVPGWLEMADKRKTTRLQPVKPRNPVKQIVHQGHGWSSANSVFQFA